jgi:hypothetical protein
MLFLILICIDATPNRLLHASYLAFAMTDHFFWRLREDRRRRATILLLTKTEDPPPSIPPHLINGIPSLRGGNPKQSVDNLLNIKIRHC